MFNAVCTKLVNQANSKRCLKCYYGWSTSGTNGETEHMNQQGLAEQLMIKQPRAACKSHLQLCIASFFLTDIKSIVLSLMKLAAPLELKTWNWRRVSTSHPELKQQWKHPGVFEHISKVLLFRKLKQTRHLFALRSSLFITWCIFEVFFLDWAAAYLWS